MALSCRQHNAYIARDAALHIAGRINKANNKQEININKERKINKTITEAE